jgi:exodeoxyribonuclease V alpha subunit
LTPRSQEAAAHRIPHKFGLDPVDDIQVLTPMQRGLLGVANINAGSKRS